jgi:hypothetical protein
VLIGIARYIFIFFLAYLFALEQFFHIAHLGSYNRDLGLDVKVAIHFGVDFGSKILESGCEVNMGSSSQVDSRPLWDWFLIQCCRHMHDFGFWFLVLSSNVHNKYKSNKIIVNSLSSIFHFFKK